MTKRPNFAPGGKAIMRDPGSKAVQDAFVWQIPSLKSEVQRSALKVPGRAIRPKSETSEFG
jgi:hypothetical protein